MLFAAAPFDRRPRVGAFPGRRSSSGFVRRSTVNRQASGTTLKFDPASTRPPTSRIEPRASSSRFRREQPIEDRQRALDGVGRRDAAARRARRGRRTVTSAVNAPRFECQMRPLVGSGSSMPMRRARARRTAASAADPHAPPVSSSGTNSTARRPRNRTPRACQRARGEQHRDEAALHVRAAAAEHRVAIDSRHELIARRGRNDVVVTVETERRP